MDQREQQQHQRWIQSRWPKYRAQRRQHCNLNHTDNYDVDDDNKDYCTINDDNTKNSTSRTIPSKSKTITSMTTLIRLNITTITSAYYEDVDNDNTDK